MARVVGRAGPQPGQQVEAAEAEHRAAVLHLAAPGDHLGTGPRPHVGLDVSPRRRPRAEPPVVDVVALRRVSLHDPPAVEPGEDTRGLLVGGETGGHGLRVQEGEAVVVGPAVEVDPAHEPPGGGIPEPPLEVGRDLAAEPADLVGRKRPAVGGDRPFRVRIDAAFHLLIPFQRLVDRERGEGVMAAERQQIPVVAPHPEPRVDRLRAVGGKRQAAAAVVAQPRHLDVLAVPDVELVEREPNRPAHPVDHGPQKLDVASPEKRVGGAVNEQGARGGMPAVDGGNQALEDDSRAHRRVNDEAKPRQRRCVVRGAPPIVRGKPHVAIVHPSIGRKRDGCRAIRLPYLVAGDLPVEPGRGPGAVGRLHRPLHSRERADEWRAGELGCCDRRGRARGGDDQPVGRLDARHVRPFDAKLRPRFQGLEAHRLHGPLVARD